MRVQLAVRLVILVGPANEGKRSPWLAFVCCAILPPVHLSPQYHNCDQTCDHLLWLCRSVVSCNVKACLLSRVSAAISWYLRISYEWLSCLPWLWANGQMIELSGLLTHSVFYCLEEWHCRKSLKQPSASGKAKPATSGATKPLTNCPATQTGGRQEAQFRLHDGEPVFLDLHAGWCALSFDVLENALLDTRAFAWEVVFILTVNCRRSRSAIHVQ